MLVASRGLDFDMTFVTLGATRDEFDTLQSWCFSVSERMPEVYGTVCGLCKKYRDVSLCESLSSILILSFLGTGDASLHCSPDCLDRNDISENVRSGTSKTNVQRRLHHWRRVLSYARAVVMAKRLYPVETNPS